MSLNLIKSIGRRLSSAPGGSTGGGLPKHVLRAAGIAALALLAAACDGRRPLEVDGKDMAAPAGDLASPPDMAVTGEDGPPKVGDMAHGGDATADLTGSDAIEITDDMIMDMADAAVVVEAGTDGPPKTGDMSVAQEDGPPKTGDMAVAKEDGPPKTGDMAVAKEDGPPKTDDLAVAQEDGPPKTGDMSDAAVTDQARIDLAGGDAADGGVATETVLFNGINHEEARFDANCKVVATSPGVVSNPPKYASGDFKFNGVTKTDKLLAVSSNNTDNSIGIEFLPGKITGKAFYYATLGATGPYSLTDMTTFCKTFPGGFVKIDTQTKKDWDPAPDSVYYSGEPGFKAQAWVVVSE